MSFLALQQLLVPDGSPTFLITGGSGLVSDITAIDSNFILVSSSSTNLVVRTSMQNPTRNLVKLPSLQSIQVQVQRNATGGGGSPTVTVEILEQGSNTVLATPINAVSMGTIDTPQTFTGTWNAAILSDISGNNVEVRVTVQTNGAGGNARSGNLGYVGWTSYQRKLIPIKAWDGAEHKDGVLKVWNGSSWISTNEKIWDGANWIEFNAS
jgi:hypothetical protein